MSGMWFHNYSYAAFRTVRYPCMPRRQKRIKTTTITLEKWLAESRLAKLLRQAKARWCSFRFNQVSASAGQREAGFLEEIKKSPDIQVILDNRYSGTTAREAQSTALKMLDKLKERRTDRLYRAPGLRLSQHMQG